MSERPYMKLWVADFLGDTLHLSDAEVGQYILLLMAMWRHGGKLPKNKSYLARVARAPVSANVLDFFNVDDATASIWQKRLSSEIEARKALSRRQSENAKARWLKHKKKPNAVAVPDACLHSHSHIKKEKRTPRDELLIVLDEQHAEAVLEHRRKLRKPLSAYAAKLLASHFAECPDANAAADVMVERGWSGLKAEWLKDKAIARRNGSGWYIKPDTAEWDAWKRYGTKHSVGDIIYGMKVAEEKGTEFHVKDRWPPR